MTKEGMAGNLSPKSGSDHRGTDSHDVERITCVLTDLALSHDSVPDPDSL